jgi:chitinase
LDFINLMAYDFHGKWERETGHNAPLHSPSSDSQYQKQLNVEHAANLWVKLGAPKEKLVIGMPTYGRSFTLSNTAKFGVHSPASGGGKEGIYTKESGFLAYYEVSGRKGLIRSKTLYRCARCCTMGLRTSGMKR